MSDREVSISRFLTDAGWSGARRVPITGDLSARRYFRLTSAGGKTSILMDADPKFDCSTPRFVEVTNWLHAADLSAPDILANAADDGLLLLEDFGDNKVSDVIKAEPYLRGEIYSLALDLIDRVHEQRFDGLDNPSPKELADLTRLADDHYPHLDKARLAPFWALLEAVLNEVLTDPPAVSLRDFHADNLIWLPSRTGVRRLGILDYQDTFLTHPIYDVVSLLTDARTDIEPEFRTEMIREYTQRSGRDLAAVSRAFAAFSAQRNLRILAIFARSASRDGKPVHLPKMPRVYGYLTEALRHPVFASVAEDTIAAIPPPTPELIGALA